MESKDKFANFAKILQEKNDFDTNRDFAPLNALIGILHGVAEGKPWPAPSVTAQFIVACAEHVIIPRTIALELGMCGALNEQDASIRKTVRDGRA